jgi:hypothetical protein
MWPGRGLVLKLATMIRPVAKHAPIGGSNRLIRSLGMKSFFDGLST